MPNEKNIRIAITGSGGFIGKNLLTHLIDRTDYSVNTISDFDSLETNLEGLKESDFVVHLAGVNRPENEAEFDSGNPGLTRRLCEAMRRVNVRPTIIYASSVQAELDNAYGRSKAACEEILRENQATSGSDTIVFRLPNVFGKWARPNYNSAIATFCYNLSHDKDITIHDPASRMSVVYIDDLIEDLMSIFSGKAPSRDETGICHVSRSYDTTVGEIANHIERIKKSRVSLVVEPVGTGLERALHATYMSYLEPDQFTHDLISHSDQRGSFVEMVKTTNSGQVSFFTAVPGATRGGHYHHTKTEKFLVISGTALFRFRHRLSGETHEIETSSKKPTIVETVPGWSHNLTNVGEDEMLVILWSSEIYDQAQPDTYATDMKLET